MSVTELQLFDAVKSGCFQKVKEIVGEFPDLAKCEDEDKRTPFHWACASNYLEIASYLFPFSDIDHKDESLWTPLHSAVSAGHREVVEYLLSNTTNGDKESKMFLDAQTESGSSPLHHAASKGRLNVVRLLVEKGCGLDIKDNNGLTPIARAVVACKPDVVEFLIKKGADCDVTEPGTKDNLLHIAVKNHDVETGSLLYEARPDLVSKINAENKSPKDLANTQMLLAWKDILESKTDPKH